MSGGRTVGTGCGSSSWPGSGPAPHAAMMLADLGADVVRVDRPSGGLRSARPGCPGSRRCAAAAGSPPISRTRRAARPCCAWSSGPTCCSRASGPASPSGSGVGPADCHARNPRLVYGRMTGWGQDGPLAARAGHDINYISLTGALHAIGRAGERPVPPLNLVGDFGGGSMLLVVGVLAALWEAQRSGQGQVVDAAMVDGASLLAQMIWALPRAGALGRRARTPTCSTAPRRSTTPTPAPTAGTSRSARWSRSSTRSCSTGLGLDPADAAGAARPSRLAGAAGAVRRGVRHPYPRRVGGGVRRHRRLRHAGAGVRRGGRRTRTLAARGTIVAPGRRRRRPPRPRGSRRTPADAARAASGPEPVEAVLGRLGRADTRPTRRANRHARSSARRRAGCAQRAVSVRRTGCRRPAGCGCGSGRPGCPGPSSWRP